MPSSASDPRPIPAPIPRVETMSVVEITAGLVGRGVSVGGRGVSVGGSGMTVGGRVESGEAVRDRGVPVAGVALGGCRVGVSVSIGV